MTDSILNQKGPKEVQKIFDMSASYAEVISRLGLSMRKQLYVTLTEYIWKNNINLEKFFLNQENKPKCNYKRLSKEDIFKKNSTFSGSLLKKIQEFSLKDCSKCEICGASEWMGKPLALQVHHKDGDHTNNELENLQILCPNCHSQTDNYGSKNTKKKNYETKHYFCVNCGKELKYRATRCLECAKKYAQSASKCPSKEELEKKLEELKTMTALGKYYKVSDNTIRNWCHKLEVSIPKKEPKKHKPKINYPTYRVDNIIKTATRWERYLDLPQHKIARYVPNHTTEEIELYIKSFYDKILINS